MSRREQNSGIKIQNPAKIFINFKGGSKGGNFEFYDKTEKVNIEIPYKSLKFLIITELITITGYNRARGGLFSNEIEDQNTEELTVKYFKGDNKLIANGLYKDIKEVVTSRSVGGKFAKSIYIALYYKKEWSLQNLKLTGKQVKSWIDLEEKLKANGVNKYEAMITVDNVEFVEGEISFHYPIFGYIQLKDSDPNQKEVMLKADTYYDIVKDFIKKRKEGVTDEEASPRKSQEEKIEQKPKLESKNNAFVDDEDDEDYDDMPF